MHNENFLTTFQVSQILNIHVKTVGLYCKEGKLTAFKRGTKNYILQSSLDEYLAKTRENKVTFKPKQTTTK